MGNACALANTTTTTQTTSSTINNNRKTQVVGSSTNNNKNNHFSSNKILAPATGTNIASSSTPKNLNNHYHHQHQHQQQQQPQKRLSILSTATTMPKHQHLPSQQIQDQDSLYHQQKSSHPQYTPGARSITPHFSYTLQNNKTSSLYSKQPSSQAFYHNSLKARDLKVLKLSLAKDCNGEDEIDDGMSDDRGDEDGDYYMPSSLEILGIQKALQNIENSINGLKDQHNGEDVNDLDKGGGGGGGDSNDDDDDEFAKYTIPANDLEISKNATNNLLKLQQQQHEHVQQQEKEVEEQEETTNRLWYH